MDEGGNVAGADRDGGLAAGVGGADHVGAAGGEDHGDGVMHHQLAGGGEGGLLETGDEPGRCAGALGGAGHDLCCPVAAARGAGMGSADDGVAGLDRGEDLEQDGGGRVGDRDDAGDDADRTADRGRPRVLIDPEDADGPHAEESVGTEPCVVEVLDDLVLEDAVAGLVDGEAGELLGGGGTGLCHGADDGVDARLVGSLEQLEGGACAARLEARVEDRREICIQRGCGSGHGLSIRPSDRIHDGGIRTWRRRQWRRWRPFRGWSRPLRGAGG